MSDKNNVSLMNVNLTGLLLTAFIVLKLCGVIAWSWWWVLAPVWMPLALIGAIFTLIEVIKFMDEVFFKRSISSFKSSTTKKQDREMKKLRKKFDKNEVSTNRFIKLADAILGNKKSTEPVNPFSLLDIEAPDSIEKSIRRHEKKINKKKFSLKRWWKEGCTGLTLFQKIKKWWAEGNKKAKEKKKKTLDK